MYPETENTLETAVIEKYNKIMILVDGKMFSEFEIESRRGAELFRIIESYLYRLTPVHLME